ncbi:putative orfan [Tupanvirus soda lake]|uniref:Orfan n=2 Tax=Tupanvirus TaxID=2094720 RepID=A0AC62AB20_9VIRU|nr:putative orfan [Tupanvirus soda lake]QKU34902.1 putative orfan [Tupanvirus soda lake]
MYLLIIMIYVDNYSIQSIVTQTGLDIKYPLIKKHNQIIVDFICNKLGRYSDYQCIGRRFINKCTKYCKKMIGMDHSTNPPTQMSFEQFLEKYFIKKHKNFCYFLQERYGQFRLYRVSTRIHW